MWGHLMCVVMASLLNLCGFLVKNRWLLLVFALQVILLMAYGAVLFLMTDS